MKVRIIDESSEFCGKEFEGYRFYYDYKHTGSSDDIYLVSTDKGEKQFLTRQIDEVYYKKQELDKFLEELGANVGDIVEVIEYGSGSYSRGFDKNGLHEITKITSNGYVQFDNGKVEVFRPKVKVIRRREEIKSFGIGFSEEVN